MKETDPMKIQKASPSSLAKESLAEEALGYAQQSKSSNTMKAYRSQWKIWKEWAQASGLPALPAPPEGVALYITWRAKTVSVATISQGLGAISHYHNLSGRPDPVHSREVQAVWKGIRRAHGVAPKRQAAPVGPELLSRLLSAMPWGSLSVRDRALLLVGFTGAFRRSELVAIEAEHLRWYPEGFSVLIPRSKTDQEGRGRRVMITHGAQRLTCPVRALKDWLALSGIEEGPVFVASGKAQTEPRELTTRSLKPPQVNKILKARAEAAGLDPEQLSGHSLRAGLVTTATAQGLSDHRIMDQTGHKTSTMIRRYRRETEQRKDGFAEKLGL